MFASTLGMSEKTLTNWLIKSEDCSAQEGDLQQNDPVQVSEEMHQQKKRGRKRVAANAIKDEDKAFLASFLDSVATVPSHYCRASYQEWKFFEPGTKLTELHTEYKERACEDGRHAVSYGFFSNYLTHNQYSVFIPRKDQCDKCTAAKMGNLPNDEYETHKNQKDQAQQAKKTDKDIAKDDPTTSVWTMDMQCVLLSPKTEASCMYYKTKLQTHNFTLYDLTTNDGYCYVWDETNGNLASNSFAWLQYSHFKRFLEENPHVKTLIIWSDGCGYQNRNSVVANAYLYLAKEMDVTIIQKYLVPGHTQMECDSMHSTIERQIVGPVFAPTDYVTLMRSARKSPRPYHVQHLTHDFFKEGFESLYVTSIRPGRRVGDPQVHDLRVLKYTKEGIQFKIAHNEDNLEPLPQRIRDVAGIVLKQSFPNRLSIKKRKYDDLQSLKSVVPQDYHNFYDTLSFS